MRRKELALLAGSILLAGAVAAVVLALFRPQLIWKVTGGGPAEETSYRLPHPVTHHALKPNTAIEVLNRETGRSTVRYEINSLGMRDPERVVPKPGGVYRLLLLGDSFVEGYNVPREATLAAVLEHTLKDAGLKSLEVVNGGVSSYSPLLEYLFLRDTALKLEPDLVVMCLDMSDIQDDMAYEFLAEFDGRGLPLAVPNRDPTRLTDRPDAETVARMKEESEAYLDRYFHTRHESVEEGGLQRHFDRTWRYIRLTADLARASGAEFLLVVYPMGHQVSSDEWSTGRKEYDLEAKVYRGAVFDYLEEKSAAEGVKFLSLLDGFRDGGEGPLFFPTDGHWTEEGTRLAARLVGDEILRRHLVGAPPPSPPPSPPAKEAAVETPEQLSRLGMAAVREGDRAKAEEYWLRVVELEPHYGMVDYNLGILYVEMERSEEAVPHIEWYVEAHSDDADGWNALGIAYATSGRVEEARGAFEKALAVDPDHRGAKTNIGLLP